MSDWARTCAKWLINETIPLAKERGVRIDELMQVELAVAILRLKFDGVINHHTARKLFRELSAGGETDAHP